MKLLRRPISASDRIPDRFCVIGMEFLSLSRRRSSSRGETSAVRRLTSTPVKPFGQPSPSVVDSPAIIADSLLSTSELWSKSPIRDLGGVDGESNKSAV